MSDDEKLELIRKQMELEQIIKSSWLMVDNPENRLAIMKIEKEYSEITRKIHTG